MTESKHAENGFEQLHHISDDMADMPQMYTWKRRIDKAIDDIEGKQAVTEDK